MKLRPQDKKILAALFIGVPILFLIYFNVFRMSGPVLRFAEDNYPSLVYDTSSAIQFCEMFAMCVTGVIAIVIGAGILVVAKLIKLFK